MIAESIYIIPKSVEEAILLAEKYSGDFKFLAGGTDVMSNKFQGNESSSCLIDLSKLPGLSNVEKREDFLSIGALVKLCDLSKYKDVRNEFPILIEAAESVGSPLIRNAATIGGNLLCENRCIYYNQSEWWRDAIGYCLKCDGDICIASGGKKACFSELVSDTAPALIALNGEIEYVDIDGIFRIKVEDIYSGDGVKPKNLPETAIIKSILIPLNRGFKAVFYKLRERKSLEFTSLTTVVSLDNNDNIKIAMAGVDPKTVVVTGKLGDEKEKLIIKALKGSRAIDNDMFTRNYRRGMINVYLNRSFEILNV